MRNKITEGLDNLVSRIQQYRDEIEQVEKDNNKLNEDLQALEKERDEGYKSFNTDTHIGQETINHPFLACQLAFFGNNDLHR